MTIRTYGYEGRKYKYSHQNFFVHLTFRFMPLTATRCCVLVNRDGKWQRGLCRSPVRLFPDSESSRLEGFHQSSSIYSRFSGNYIPLQVGTCPRSINSGIVWVSIITPTLIPLGESQHLPHLKDAALLAISCRGNGFDRIAASHCRSHSKQIQRCGS